ncbi:MAG TPA: acetyl-CoA carboxylase carboxyltransferase subunit alpha [Firmicutes bacterium]|jgi:acetyl-CoA carboxylase carboxyl transferase subunit alpha|nr:acetyl-CoA carboxylase carboxyltransferase subunit alpha [Bacillota bacterium]
MSNGSNYNLDFERPLKELEKRIEEIKLFAEEKKIDMSEEIARMEEKAHSLKTEIYKKLTPWQKVQIARHPKRPTFLEYINLIFDGFIELHGDRLYRDDPALVGGLAYLEEIPVTILGQQKGRDTKENIFRNFGMPHPEGYRKAIRLMKQAEKFGRPVITFVDVAGAFPGKEAEERGQGEAVARAIMEMAGLRTPIVVVITGEGGSGGALAVGVGDRLLMLENAYYSVISPEGCASILWKDASKAPQAAEVLRITADDLIDLQVVDELIPEPLGGAHTDPEEMAIRIKTHLLKNLKAIIDLDFDHLLAQRYEKFRRIGRYLEE